MKFVFHSLILFSSLNYKTNTVGNISVTIQNKTKFSNDLKVTDMVVFCNTTFKNTNTDRCWRSCLPLVQTVVFSATSSQGIQARQSSLFTFSSSSSPASVAVCRFVIYLFILFDHLSLCSSVRFKLNQPGQRKSPPVCCFAFQSARAVRSTCTQLSAVVVLVSPGLMQTWEAAICWCARARWWDFKGSLAEVLPASYWLSALSVK